MFLVAAACVLACGSVIVLAPGVGRLLIRWRLRGYVREATSPDLTQPEGLTGVKRVAVLGAGVAGLTAAMTLARRGFAVTLYEKSPYIGGKLGSWQVERPDADPVWVSHGFHAFFPHYHNLNRFLDSLGLRRRFRRISDYVILGRNGDRVAFGASDRTPIFNLLGLARAGVFRLGDALQAPGRDLYGALLEYDERATFARYDDLSFKAFNDLAKIPPRLKLAFDTFSRAFFADESRLSFAELIKSFHFYYLGHDGGLMYDYPDEDYESSLLAPIRLELERLGATIHLGHVVERLEREEGAFRIDGESFDKVVLATDVTGSRALVEQARGLPEDLVRQFSKLGPGQRYAVLRLWLDTDVRDDIPVFVITERMEALDAVAAYHRIEGESTAWAREHGGSVLELHCYSIPESMSDVDAREALQRDMFHFFPELSSASVIHEVWNAYDNFTPFHVGMYRDRPEVATGLVGLACAGDWVKLPFPAMLLEAACASGLLAANQFCREEGLREERIQSVPLRGLMAGVPEPPNRRKLIPPG